VTRRRATTVRFGGTAIAATLVIIFPTSTAVIANVDKSASATIDVRTLHMGMESVTCIPVDMERGSEVTGHLGGFVVTFPLVPLFLIK
jgi:hypothetical protein